MKSVHRSPSLSGRSTCQSEFDIMICVFISFSTHIYPSRLDVEEVTGFVVRAGSDKSLDLVELNKKDKPKKAEGGDNKLK